MRPLRRFAPRRATVALLPLLAAAACSGDHRADRAERDAARDAAERAAALATGDSGRALTVSLGTDAGASVGRDTEPPLGPGDVRVTSTDGMVVLSVIGDSVRMRLGDSVVAKTRHEMDRTADTGGLGGMIASSVKSAVAGAMGAMTRFAVRFPAASVRDLRYEGGELSFSTGGKGSAVRARVAPADAERFMAAVRARQAQAGDTAGR